MMAQQKNLSGSITHDQRCRETARSWRWLLARVTSMSFFWTIARTMDLNWSVSVSLLPWAVEDTERTVIARTTLTRVRTGMAVCMPKDRCTAADNRFALCDE
jgi:hypothetical protein